MRCCVVHRLGPAFFALLLATIAVSQTRGKAELNRTLLSIRVRGLARLTEQQVIDASGLKLGRVAREADFKNAAQKLGETGMFTNVTYSFHYSPEGCDLELQVTENDQLVPIVFDNFVWWSDDELIKQLRAQVPLFTGLLPTGGNLADRVAAALNAILAERKIGGEVEYAPAAAMNGPVDSFVYKVNFHSIQIHNVDFPGASETELPQLRVAAQSLAGQEYLRTKMRSQEKLSFLPVYLAHGYLKAHFDDAQAKAVQEGVETQVDVSVPVSPGKQYKVTDVAWAGNLAFPADKLQVMIHLKMGEPANAVQLDRDLRSVQKLYGTKGYLTAQMAAAPVMDDSQATVSYRLKVAEGDQYRMGELNIDGIDDSAIKRIMSQWQMKKGDPFDNSYMQRFFSVMYRDVGLRSSYNVIPKQFTNAQDKTVSVALHFVPK